MADLISHTKSPLYHQFIVRSGMRIRILSHQRPRSNVRHASMSVTYIILFVACVISSCFFLIVP